LKSLLTRDSAYSLVSTVKCTKDIPDDPVAEELPLEILAFKIVFASDALTPSS
jgi:hypothetical protein